MNKTGKVNGFRIMCRLAMAELMLRKQENRARQGFKIPEGYEPTVVITEPDFVPGGADQAKDRLRRNEHQ